MGGNYFSRHAPAAGAGSPVLLLRQQPAQFGIGQVSLIPAWLVYKVPALHKYKGVSLVIIIITGLLLCVSPFLAFS